MTADADTSNSKIGKKSTGKRKFHKKSRNGCATCKRRRVKCDEGRPICGNCERMNIECVYVKAEDVVLPSKQNVEKSIHKQVIMGQTVKTEHTTQHETAVPKQGASSIMDNHTLNYVSDAINAATSVPLQPSESLQSSAIPDLGIPSTPIIPNSTSLPLSPISQLIQQNLPQSPAAMQLLNSFPPDMQIKLVQQFQQLPVDKQQQLYQSLPMSIKPSSNMSELPPAHIPDDVGSLLSNLKPSADSISEFLGDLIPDRNLIKPSNMNMDVTPTPQELAAHIQQRKQNSKDIPNDRHHGVSANMNSNSTTSNSSNNSSKSNQAAGPSLSPDSIRSSIHPLSNSQSNKNGTDLNMLDLRLMYHYTTKVWPTITAAGISDSKIWSDDIPMLAFQYPFLMHSVLAFSATHLSRNEKGLDQCVTCHRAEALRLLGDAVLEMSPENTDALVASALILIMDSLANASLPTSSSIKSLPPSAWIFHVKGAATILTAVWPLSETSRFYKFISVDLGDLADIGYDLISGELANTSDGNENARPDGRSRERGSSSSPLGNTRDSTTSPANEKYSKTSPNPNISARTDFASTSSQFKKQRYSRIECFDEDISDMFPIPLTSPYFPTLAYMARLHKERYKSDFILRIFAFPALLDKRFLGLLINCDLSAMRIMRCYYKLLRNFTEEMKEKVWFLEGVSSVLPVDVEQYAGGGGMHMMLDFLGGPSTIDDDGNGENYVAKSAVQSGLLDTNNLPSASMAGDLGLDETGLNNDADIDD